MFFDRYDAGQLLAAKLKKYKDTNTIIYALPRGGVLVAGEVCREIDAPLEVLLTGTIKHPLNEKVILCSLTEDGEKVCDDFGSGGIDDSWVENEFKIKLQETKANRLKYTKGLPLRSAQGKTAIVIDDGISTGLVMKAALLTIKKQRPANLVLAVPVCPSEALAELRKLTDEVVVLSRNIALGGEVSTNYTYFPKVSESDMMQCLKHTNRLHYLKNRYSVVTD